MTPDLFYEMDEVEEKHWWFEGRRRIVASILERLNLPDDALILDVGCGTGANFKALNRFGRIIGFERNPTAIRLAKKKSAAGLVLGEVPHLPLKPNQFDLITLLDVLEHLGDDEASLSAIWPLLKPGGYLMITVPAFSFLWSFHDDRNHHKRRYSLNSLRSILSKLNGKINFIGYYNFFLFPIVAAIRLLHVHDKLKVPPPALNAALTMLFSSEKAFIRHFRFPFGVSIAACVQKS